MRGRNGYVYKSEPSDEENKVGHAAARPQPYSVLGKGANNIEDHPTSQRDTTIPKKSDIDVTDNEGTEDPVSVTFNDDYEDGVYVEGDTLLLTTGEVARRLGISRDMTRQHIKEFSEFLHVSYNGTTEGKYRHMRIPSTDVELLEWIVRLRKNRHSVEQGKDLLRDPAIAGSLNFKSPDYNELFDEILKRNNAFLLGNIQNMLEGTTKENQKLLELSKDKDIVIDEMAKKIDALEQTLEQQNQVMTSMKALLEEQVQSAQASKKKGFFGFFK